MLSIFFIGLALSMDAFGLSIGIGMQKISKRTFILLPLCVAVFHFVMPMLGNSFSFFIRDILYFDPSFLMVAVFFYLSVMMFVTRNNEDNVILKSFISILFTSFSVSIDSLTVGLGLSSITNHYIASSIIFSTCAGCLTYIGLMTGKYSKKCLKKEANVFGSVLLFILAIVNLCKIFFN